MKQHIRIISVMLCIVMVFSIVLSATFIINFKDHECIGDKCEICCHIHACEQTLKKLAIGASVLAEILALRTVSAPIPLLSHCVRFRDTLISMKVKLSC